MKTTEVNSTAAENLTLIDVAPYYFLYRFRDIFYLGLTETGIKGQAKSSSPDMFCLGQITFFIAILIPEDGIQMTGAVVNRHADAILL